MSPHPSIKAADIRVGDTIQWGDARPGYRSTFEMTVSRISNDGDFIQVFNGPTIRHFKPDYEVSLVDRPGPKLPTTPGSLILAYEVCGEHNGDGWPMILDASGDWTGVIEVSGRCWHLPEDINKWSPATVSKATMSTEPSISVDIDETDYCYVCDAVTLWTRAEVCTGCGRVWGYEPGAGPGHKSTEQELGR